MHLYNVEDQSFVKNRNTTLIAQSVTPEYLFFVDILTQLYCGARNTNVSDHDIPKKVSFKGKGYRKVKRRRRGVMENIVSAYSEIFTKG